MKTLNHIELAGRTVIVREDLNVPIENGIIVNDRRLRLALSTVRRVQEAGAKVLLMSHLGRPTEGEYNQSLSLAPVAAWFSQYLKQPVALHMDITRQPDLKFGEVMMLENTRFNVGEKTNDPTLAKQYAALAEVCVMDAFATAHRDQASTTGLVKHVKTAVAGPLLLNEVNTLGSLWEKAKRPIVAIVGGAKAETKAALIERLLVNVDALLTGGGVANTLLAAAGHEIGQSLHWPEGVDSLQALCKQAKRNDVELLLPSDVVVANSLDAQASAEQRSLAQVQPNESIFDVGRETAEHYASILANAGTIIWNGPLGIFQDPRFSFGTRRVAQAVASSSAFTVVGGGETVAALEQLTLLPRMDYVSSGGGAFLTLLEGRALPVVQALEQRS